MPIDTTCPSCNRVLRVADEHAGKQARCPVCNEMYTIPAANQQPAATPPPNAAANQSPTDDEQLVEASTAEEDTSQWSMKTPEGAMYGPVNRATLDRWFDDGRIAADCYLAEGDSGSWRPAGQIFPQLAAGYTPPPSPGQPSQAGPSQGYGGGVNQATGHATNNPYAGPRTSTVGYQGVAGSAHLRPHRGGLILALGLLGLLTCQLLGIMAWLMGSEDLKEIRAGRMDPEGEGMTQAGTVLGMISSLLLALSLVGVLLFLFIMAAVAAGS